MSHNLKEYKADEEFGNGLVYSIPEVEAVLKDMEAKMELLVKDTHKERDEYINWVNDLQKRNIALRIQVQKMMKIMYKACANWAMSNTIVSDVWEQGEPKKWLDMKDKCLELAKCCDARIAECKEK